MNTPENEAPAGLSAAEAPAERPPVDETGDTQPEPEQSPETDTDIETFPPEDLPTEPAGEDPAAEQASPAAEEAPPKDGPVDHSIMDASVAAQQLASMQVPKPSRIVLYRLTQAQADQVNKRRKDAQRRMEHHRRTSDGSQIHVGNPAFPGNAYPMLIVAAHGDRPDSSVNGQVFLDGNDVLWATSVSVGEGPGTFSWPVRD